jgi:hypothetical protein
MYDAKLDHAPFLAITGMLETLAHAGRHCWTSASLPTGRRCRPR